jgi:anion-transporting  ArsA/GET3 family ATPase
MAEAVGKRLQLVVGKGGVGKSTLAAAIALAEAGRGARVLAMELGGPGGLARIFGRVPSEPGVPVEVRPRLSIATVEGEAALAEYLELVVPIRRFLAAVFTSRVYRFFVAAAPGLKELMTMGKIWYEEDRKVDGRPAWDVLVVDAGASGHSLQYLQMPGTAAETFSSGLVHREAGRVQALLEDDTRTEVHVVALPEEMPVVEATQIIARLRGDLALPLGAVYVNRCRETAPAGAAAAVERLRAARCAEPRSTSSGEEEARIAGYPVASLREGLEAAAVRALAWEAVQERSIERLRREAQVEIVRLPFVVAEEFGLHEVERLAAVVAAAREGRA